MFFFLGHIKKGSAANYFRIAFLIRLYEYTAEKKNAVKQQLAVKKANVNMCEKSGAGGEER